MADSVDVLLLRSYLHRDDVAFDKLLKRVIKMDVLLQNMHEEFTCGDGKGRYMATIATIPTVLGE